jgi:hypothetical protein
LANQAENVFYREATFYSAQEVEQLLRDAGFCSPVWVQTLLKPLDETREIEPLRAGYGVGAFVVVKVGRA